MDDILAGALVDLGYAVLQALLPGHQLKVLFLFRFEQLGMGADLGLVVELELVDRQVHLLDPLVLLKDIFQAASVVVRATGQLGRRPRPLRRCHHHKSLLHRDFEGDEGAGEGVLVAEEDLVAEGVVSSVTVDDYDFLDHGGLVYVLD